MLACSPGTIFERGQSIRKVATTRGVPVHGFLETAGPDLGNVDIVFGAGLGVFIDENSISPGGLELASMARGVASILQRKGIHRLWTQCPRTNNPATERRNMAPKEVEVADWLERQNIVDV